MFSVYDVIVYNCELMFIVCFYGFLVGIFLVFIYMLMLEVLVFEWVFLGSVLY